VTLPALGTVPAQGLSLRELKRELDERYAQEIEGIEVTPVLTKRASRYVFVLGEVKSPGRYTLDADLAVTTDYRDVLSEVVASLYPERSLAAIFPSFRHKALGFMAGNSGHVDEGKETVGPTKPVPKSYFKSYGTRTGTARLGAKMKAPKPKLTTAGKKARVKTTYRWETVSKTGKVKKRKKTRTLTVPASYQGKRLRVRVTYKAKGFKPRVKVFSWGKVKKRKKK